MLTLWTLGSVLYPCTTGTHHVYAMCMSNKPPVHALSMQCMYSLFFVDPIHYNFMEYICCMHPACMAMHQTSMEILKEHEKNEG